MTDTVHSTVGSADAQHDHAGHDHAGHDHAGHDHAGHDHAGHDHAGHDHAGHDHAGHDHAGHDLAGHVHGDSGADGPGSDRAGRAAADLDQVVAATPAAPEADPELIEEIEEALKDVVDPELGINIVDLGLVYDVHVDSENVATIDMTLTSAACPLTEMIEEQVSAALVGEAGLVNDFRINWVWLPPWGPEKITEDGREQMRALGFNI